MTHYNISRSYKNTFLSHHIRQQEMRSSHSFRRPKWIPSFKQFVRSLALQHYPAKGRNMQQTMVVLVKLFFRD